MPIITITDIYSRIYEEIVTEITRDETALVDQAIRKATDEAKMYLSRWDLVALFGTADNDPTVDSEDLALLKDLCIDIAIWKLVRLGNPNIKYDPAKEGYKDAVRTLEKLQAGKMQPNGWPYKDTTGETAPKGDSIQWFSNRKTNFHF